ncbi:arginine--tRNA ligase [Patescibacteria group bacterium]|nr:arginine--tRNA ligase [Patescibacteria group bacterium]
MIGQKTKKIFSELLKKQAKKALSDKIDLSDIVVEFPLPEFGDYSLNLALKFWQDFGFKNPHEFAVKIKEDLDQNKQLMKVISKIQVEEPGFINFWLKPEYLLDVVKEINKAGSRFGRTREMSQKIMVEYAHPNTHKEMHIGHMRTLITGEALSRIFETAGAKVFRANYQGDIGPHVAKSIWGTIQLLKERSQTWEQWEAESSFKKAHLLGEGYVRGNQDYESHKEEIDDLNADLYQNNPKVMPIYFRTRKWCLDYYDNFYKRFGTHFDRLFFESEVAEEGKKLVLANLGKIFEKSDGAIIFDGTKYGLHKRVFVTAEGYPTYEGKEMYLAQKQRQTFKFDKNVHVVANEQAEYFKVVFKAIELLDPWFKNRERHLSMGMVNLVNQKISSRRGIVITVDGLLDEVKTMARQLTSSSKELGSETEDIIEKITLAAVKYSVLKAHPTLNVEFDLKRSVDMDGSSGPYIQYVFARCKSVLEKAKGSAMVGRVLSDEELVVARWLTKFPEIILRSAEQMAPNLICSYLFELCQKFNNFYQKNRIIGSKEESSRLALTKAVAQVIENGLWLLGIEAPSRM